MLSVLLKLKKEIKTFFRQVSISAEHSFFVLFWIYLVSNMMYMIGWETEWLNVIWNVYIALYAIVMWGSAIYLLYIIIEWKELWHRKALLIMSGAIIFLLTALISKRVTRDSFAFIMGVFFCVMAYGKSYRKILYSFLALLVAILAVGWIGLQAGVTFDAAKPDRIYGGHSLGILYPNNWGFLVFAVMILCWYLFLQRKSILTVFLFWTVGAFTYKYITSWTAAGMMILFPVVGIAGRYLQEKIVKGTESRSCRVWIKSLHGLIIALPFLAFGVMLFFCWQMDWVHEHFFGTRLQSFAMRFVEGGYAMRLNGISLFGQPLKQMGGGIIDYLYDIDMKIDSAYISYMLIRGVLSVLITLVWIAAAHYRCLKNKDYCLVIISGFMLLFSMMERPGLDAWYNFVLLYPLAALRQPLKKYDEKAL